MTVYDADWIRDDTIIHEFGLDNIDEVYRSTKNKNRFIFKIGTDYYIDTYSYGLSYGLLFSNDKILKFTKTKGNKTVDIFYKYNAYLSKIFDNDIYRYSSHIGDGWRVTLTPFYYSIGSTTYLTKRPYITLNDVVVENPYLGEFISESFCDPYAEIQNDVMTRYGTWRDRIYITGDNEGDLEADRNYLALQAMAETPTVLTIKQYLDLYPNNIIKTSKTLAGIYEAPNGSTERIGYELWTYQETINDETVEKTARKNIELFKNAENQYKWMVDDYATETEPKYNNSPQILTRDSDGATITITYDSLVSASELIPICEGQAWR